jgi:hypothetical protein
MYIKTLLRERDNWKFNTIENIKKSLSLYDDKISTSKANLEKSEKLVVIYGLPQIGKTTLILNLLGIKKEFFSSVYDTLRADVEYGTSSTSTAIIYKRSENEQYGFAFKQNLMENINMTYLSEGDFKNKLKELRNLVESKKMQTNILFIAIPKHYYSDSGIEHSNIDILDMPGVDSKNYKEKSHVDSLFKTYMALSSLCIIACAANQIQSIETLKLPNDDEDRWSEIPSRYIVVTTKSYSQEIIKKELLKGKSAYFNFIHKYYKDELRKVLNSSTELEIYPVDVGDSFKALCKEIPSIKEKLEETREKFFEEIRKTVQTRRGNDLKNIIDNLNESIKVYAKKIENELKKEKEEINTDIDEINTVISKSKNDIENVNKDIGELKNQNEEESKKNISLDLSEICEECDNISSYEEKTKEDFKKQTIKKRFYSWIDALNKEAKEEAREIDINFVKFPDEIENILIFPTEYVYKQKFLHYRHSPANRRNGKLEECKDRVLSVLQNYCSKLEEFLKEKQAEKIKQQKDKTDKKVIKYNNLKKRFEQKQNESEKYLLKNQNQKKEKEYEIKKLKEQQDHDESLLKNYKETAKDSFKEQQSEILSKINDSNLSVEKRLAYIIFLGICETDYKKIIGVINNE